MASALLIVRPSLQHLSKNAYPKSLALFVKSPMANQSKSFVNDARSASRKARMAAKNPTLKKSLMAPEQETGTGTNTANNKGVIFGASILGLGALCYFEIKERSKTWPQYVKDRVKSTYGYLGKGFVMGLASTSFFYLISPWLSNLVPRNPLLATAAIFVAVVESLHLALSLPYSDSFGAKHWAFYTHCGIIGAIVAVTFRMTSIPLATRAAFYAAGAVGGFSTFAVHAPEKVLIQGEPLTVACGLGVYLATALGYYFTPGAGAALSGSLLYGWTVLFGGLLLHETHEIAKTADSDEPYDPINESIFLNYRYSDIGIIIRIVTILAEHRRKDLSVL